MTAPAFPSLDAQDRELAAMCDGEMVTALSEGDMEAATYFYRASAWHAGQIEARRSARIWGTLAAIATVTGRVP